MLIILHSEAETSKRGTQICETLLWAEDQYTSSIDRFLLWLMQRVVSGHCLAFCSPQFFWVQCELQSAAPFLFFLNWTFNQMRNFKTLSDKLQVAEC